MRLTALLSFVLLAMACGSSPPHEKDSGSDMPPQDAATNADFAVSGDNVIPMIVDTGPTAATYPSYNVPYVSVKVCAPGSTTNCQTIDHVLVDTGSTGTRFLTSIMNASLLSALPTVPTGANTLTECYTYADGFVYGPVRTADIYLGGESAKAMEFHALGDPAFAAYIPSSCTASGMEEDTVDTFGANGIIGVGLFNPDCGADCVPAVNQPGPFYYSCPMGAACTAVGVPLAQQVPNPVSMFASDNNGVILQLPAISDAGALTAIGALIFGIGTQANNALGDAKVYEATNDGQGTITTNFNGQSISYSFFDSGTVDLSFTDSSIPRCTGDLQGFDCPTATLNLTAMITGGMTTGAFDFKVANTMTTLDFDTTPNTAFDDLADSGDGPGFDWGLSAFYGRRIFFGIADATPGGAGPYFAF